MYNLKINGYIYPAEFTGKMKDVEWDNRQSKTITLELSYDIVTSLFHDDVHWSIYRSWTEKQPKIDPETGEVIIDPETGEPVMEDVTKEEEFDNSDYSMLGDIIVHNDGKVSVKMGKTTDLEEAYEILYGGN